MIAKSKDALNSMTSNAKLVTLKKDISLKTMDANSRTVWLGKTVYVRFARLDTMLDKDSAILTNLSEPNDPDIVILNNQIKFN